MRDKCADMFADLLLCKLDYLQVGFLRQSKQSDLFDLNQIFDIVGSVHVMKPHSWLRPCYEAS